MLDDSSKQRVRELCELIVKELDHHRFSVLIAELNHLLEEFDPNVKKSSQ